LVIANGFTYIYLLFQRKITSAVITDPT